MTYRNKEWYEKNKEKHIKNVLAWRAKNPEKVKVYAERQKQTKEYKEYIRNYMKKYNRTEKAKLRKRKWAAQHSEERKIYMHKWRLKNPDYRKKYAEKRKKELTKTI